VFPNGTKMVLRDNIDMELLKAIVHLFDWGRCFIYIVS
jgi:hypothetical protein